jgi:membrane-bound lytic murein transglycosylase D
MMRVAWWIFPAFLLLLPGPSRATDFPRPASLEPQIRFWVSIFTEYSRDQVLVHDARDLDKVYRVLDFRPDRARGLSDATIDKVRSQETTRAMREIQATLGRLGRSGPQAASLTPEERRIAALFGPKATARDFRVAVDQVRSQRGIRERFHEGMHKARRYLPDMERVFRAEGLPVELTRLPLVESSFDVRAYSKVGAAGMWQFMPSTGRRFMMVGQLVDERLDPVTSTLGAARFLRENYEMLGSWPLAITAYNHGPGGMRRAVNQLGTKDIATIIRRYDGRAFGFSSRNFYPEFLAALDVDRDAEKYFGPIPDARITPTTLVRLDYPVGIGTAAKLARTDTATLVEHNPALLSPVRSALRDIPSGYRLRIPDTGASGFERRLAAHAAERKVTRVASGPTRRDDGASTYRVSQGDNLTLIAKRHGVSVRELQAANGMGRSSLVRTGQVMKIPGARSHRVTPGQTLSHIARRYGVSVSSLQSINGMGSSSQLRAGQVIRIPGSS